MLVAMAGLPASGKSTLARRLNARLPFVLLDKDVLRSTLFADRVDYSRKQNDLVVDCMFRVAAYLHRHHPAPAVLIDGRTFSERYQIDALKEASEAMGEVPCIIECRCSEETARQRLADDRASHPAADRDFSLYLRRRATAEPILETKLMLDTDRLSLDDCVARALSYIRDHGRQHGGIDIIESDGLDEERPAASSREDTTGEPTS